MPEHSDLLDSITEDHDDLFPWTWGAWLEADWHDGLVMGSITSPNGRRTDGTMHTYWQIAAPIWEPHGRLICHADQSTIEHLRRIIAAHEAEPRVAATALADNVRLAHRLEVAEMDLTLVHGAAAIDQARLARFMAEHPLIFQMDPEP